MSTALAHQRKVFTDVHNNELFSLKKKHFTLHKSFHAEDSHGHDIFVVKGEFSCKFACLFLFVLGGLFSEGTGTIFKSSESRVLLSTSPI